MAVLHWIADNWFELFQTFIGGGVIFFAYSIRKDTRARRIGNLIAINEQHRETWKFLYEYPELERVLSKDPDLERMPVSAKERLFTTKLILNLSIAYRAMESGELVTFEGLLKDVKEFFSLPIPNAVWQKAKSLQNTEFVNFVETALDPVRAN